MADIFVSYATEDRERIRPLVEALQAEGWSVWWDPKLRGGKPFSQDIERALSEARCVIVVWSNKSIDSYWVAAEATKGLNRDILVGQPDTLMKLSIICFCCTFVLTYGINVVSKSLNADRHQRMSLILLGTRKNTGLAAVIALSFYGPEAAIPSGVAAFFAVFNLIWLTTWSKKGSISE